jgi:cobaltochelatase CobT
VLEDQRKFGDAVHDLLESLDMGEDRSSSEEEEDGEEGDQDRRKDENGEKGEAADSEDMEKMSMEDAEASADSSETSEEAVDSPAADMADDSGMGESETAAEPWRPRNRPNEPRSPDYRPFTMRFDETIPAEERAARGARSPARLSRQAALQPAGRRRPSRQPAAAP